MKYPFSSPPADERLAEPSDYARLLCRPLRSRNLTRRMSSCHIISTFLTMFALKGSYLCDNEPLTCRNRRCFGDFIQE